MPRVPDEVWAERRQNLIEAAWRCASRIGSRELNVDEICAEAGASKGSFYTNFDSKQDLQLALLDDDALDDLMADLERRASLDDGSPTAEAPVVDRAGRGGGGPGRRPRKRLAAILISMSDGLRLHGALKSEVLQYRESVAAVHRHSARHRLVGFANWHFPTGTTVRASGHIRYTAYPLQSKASIGSRRRPSRCRAPESDDRRRSPLLRAPRRPVRPFGRVLRAPHPPGRGPALARVARERPHPRDRGRNGAEPRPLSA